LHRQDFGTSEIIYVNGEKILQTGLSSEFRAPIIITETVIQRLKNKNAYKYRFIGEANVKGKLEELKVFEILGGEENEILEKKIKSLKF
jgi:hypothetical protein